GDGQGTVRSMPRVGSPCLAFATAEVRQQVVEAPAGVSSRGPFVEILFLAAHVYKPVDRAGPAKDLAARVGDSAVVKLGFGYSRIEPVVSRMITKLTVANRQMYPRTDIPPTGFQQQHAASTGTKTVRQDTARRT